MTIHQGWKRQLRRMFAEVGAPVRRLVRVRIGSLRLEGLAAGDVRPLTPAEVRRLGAGQLERDAGVSLPRVPVSSGRCHPTAPMPAAPAATATRIVVALDGPASSGKSSVGAAAAERLGLRFVDTGLLYRALTALALREGVATDDAPALVGAGRPGHAGRRRRAGGWPGSCSTARTPPTPSTRRTWTPPCPPCRACRRCGRRSSDRQRALTAGGGIILAGRDIGTVVLPDARLKLYLDASVEERAARRIAERGLDPGGAEADLVREQLRARDAQDRGRAVAPLRPADDAVVISTDGLGFEESVDLVAATIARAETAR